jgi:SAM-dependent methyltransferase
MNANAQQTEPLAPTFSSAIVDARNYMDWIVTTLRPYLGRNVLEAGIGHGSYYEYLGKLGRYRGVDIDPANVEGARARFPGGDFALADICSDEFRSRFAPGSVDTVVCCNVIEHIEDDNRAVANLAKPLLLKAFTGAPVDILELRYFNPIGGLAWWLNRFAKHRTLDDDAVNAQIRIFDKYLLPISRMVDPLTRSFFGQSMICVARRR